ncbi:MAG: Unknown protein [uncultured Thiotrichaceae bacterium]|uniref:Uncharacterized protein n=1 Tax=uncultured Thiotrichaceae bacterium TaxID=298394 RepID=A0A6S6S4N1_9GAMM|nr:MAG: Unknown protein [uncultured Thiotrichaceae bacterium]
MNTTIKGNAIGSGGTTMTDSTRRLWVLLCAALLPITVSILLTGVFYSLGDYRVVERVPAATDFAAISYPQQGKRVDAVFTAKGVLIKLPENTTQAYLMMKRNQRYWPKHPLGSTPGEWSKEISEPQKNDSRLSLVVLAVGAEGIAQIDQWHETSQKTGEYPGMADIVTAQEIAQVEVRQQ